MRKNNYKPLPITMVQDFSRQLVESVAYMHELRLVHTDVSRPRAHAHEPATPPHTHVSHHAYACLTLRAGPHTYMPVPLVAQRPPYTHTYLWPGFPDAPCTPLCLPTEHCCFHHMHLQLKPENILLVALEAPSSGSGSRWVGGRGGYCVGESRHV